MALSTAGQMPNHISFNEPHRKEIEKDQDPTLIQINSNTRFWIVFISILELILCFASF